MFRFPEADLHSNGGAFRVILNAVFYNLTINVRSRPIFGHWTNLYFLLAKSQMDLQTRSL
jgi:hypothetical protein